jgi:ATP-dependent helicase/nuclease subunit A
MPSSSARKWTPEQFRAITTTGRSLLVSAAAGSGKTSVLAERCVHLVCDAQPRCNVNQLLVVTFTEAAAAEMKARIEQALRQRLEKAGDGDDHLRRQFALIEHIHCSTLHGFCNRLLRQHFHRLGLDPSFRVLDGEEAVLLRMETVRDLFMDCYDHDAAGNAFQRFIDAFGEGDDEALMRTVVRTHELLCSLVHPHGWMDVALRRIRDVCDKPFETTELGKEYLALVADQLNDLERDCKANIEAIRRMGGFDSYLTYLGDLLATIETWRHLLHDRGYDALAAAVRDVTFDRMPSVKSATPNKDVAQKLVEDVKNQCTKGPLAQSLRFTSKEWQDGLRSVCEHSKVFLDLVAEFAKRYRKEKDAIRAVDFADLERLALKLLNEGKGDQLRPTPVARVLHRQYQHVLVDEYQDINEVQDAILTLVSKECVGKAATANLFCVGDVKQSIYRFRLAEPARFLERYARFASGDGIGSVIDLQANFRSRAPLLEVLNKVFERLMTEAAAEIEYDDSHRLHAKATFAAADGASCFSGSPVELHLVPDEFGASGSEESDDTALGELERSEREAVVVAHRIQELMGQHGCPRMHVIDRGKGARPLEYRDIVILLRATRYHADQYADVLRQHGIPVYNNSGGGYFDAMEVRDMLSLLRLLDNQRQDIPMAAVLRSPLSGLADPEDCLARIRLAYREPGIAFHEAVVRYAKEKDDELAAKLRDFLNDLTTWRELVRERPVADLLWSIYERTGFVAFCSGLENGQQRCANLIALYERARQFGTFSRQGLYRFIRFLENLSAETDAAQASELGEADNVVRVMSVHKSKGLEFPVVFLPELGKRINFQGCSGTIVSDRHAYLGFTAIDERKRIRYPSLASTLVSSRLRRQTLAEELRVLYVAMTRAKEHLILVGTCKETAVEGWHRAWDLHQGPLPVNTILGARTMLDWLGPVAAALSGDEPPSIQIFDHPAEEIAKWVTDAEPVDRAEQVGRLAKLEPFPEAPPDDPVARQIIERLRSRYRHGTFCKLAASVPVTALARGVGNGVATPQRASVATLSEPRFLLEEKTLSATDRGTAVHLFLEHLDYTRPSPEHLRDQLESLVSRKIMTRSQADSVDLGVIEWFLQSEPGRLLRERATSVRREVPVTFPLPPESCGGHQSDDPLDRVMARGRIDLLLPDDRGFTLIDYKTDHVTPETMQQRADTYRAQLDLYRQAIHRITGQPVHTCHLVFLAARAVLTL